jgi:hypothetical protein
LKRREKNILKKYYQLGSLLLIALFLSVSVIQALHSHKTSTHSEQSSTNDSEKVSDANDCKLCDYLHHKEGKQLFFAGVASIVLAVPEPITYQTHSFIGNYKFTLQDFTNKGPPAASC